MGPPYGGSFCFIVNLLIIYQNSMENNFTLCYNIVEFIIYLKGHKKWTYY